MPINVNTKAYDTTVDRAAMVRLYEKRVVDTIEGELSAHALRLDDVIRNGNITAKGRKLLSKEIQNELLATYTSVYKASKRSLVDLFSDQMTYAYQNVVAAVGPIWKAERPLKRVSEDFVLNKPLYQDKTLLQGWSNISVAERQRIEAGIRTGVAKGKTIEQIALDIRQGNVHKISRQQSRSLAVTSVTSVTNQADHAVYAANEKALAGWQFVAVLDGRTSSQCARNDSHIFPMSDTANLPPLHWHCRSTTTPVFKSWEDMANMEGVAQVRRENLSKLTAKQQAFYDGQTPLREPYQEWLMRQDKSVQLRHLGDYQRVALFRAGDIEVSQFTNPTGGSVGIRELRALTDTGHVIPGDTKKFAIAKARLDSMQLWARNPDDFINNRELRTTLADYYVLQATELDGTLSMINFRGALLHNKKATRARVLRSPPTEDQLKFNPITGRYEDVRLYAPNPAILANNLRLVRESEKLKDVDKEFILNVVTDLEDRLGVNERAVIADNLRIVFGRSRENKDVWGSFKGAAQAQVKFDVMNVSDAIETNIRRDSDVLKKLTQDNYIDPVLGGVQLQDLHDNFISNIVAKNRWEDTTAPKIARELRSAFDATILKEAPLVWKRLETRDIEKFYLKMAHRLSLADSPDRDAFALALGRDLFNQASFNGTRKEWYNLGMKMLEAPTVSKFFKVETFGVQKRRMKSRLSNNYFGPYYDTLAYNIRIVDPRIQQYSQLTRKVDLGLRVAVTDDKNKLVFREGYKTYFYRTATGLEDTRIPITSTNSFSDFPEALVDKSLTNALGWASETKYKVDNDFYDFVHKMLYFEDDRGRAKHYNEINEYRKYLSNRGDAYERLKTMEWLRKKDAAFSNHAFVDHRARIYDRGLISPQSGESFRPFLNTAKAKAFSKAEFYNFQDQVGAFLGGLNDQLEGRFNSLTITGRQKIAEKWRPEMIKLGYHMQRAKPADIRAVLDSPLLAMIDGEEQGKFLRFAIEMSKMDTHLNGNYLDKSLDSLDKYMISLALEQDASSSGAQIIALTTRNKQLAELSNVVPTNQKRRLYDEIAAATFNDPEFRKINVKLGLTEKDLRKAAKAQNMVTFYGAGERTGILNVEGKLGKILGKDSGTLVVTASDRETVLNEISARIARIEKYDPAGALEMRTLRTNVKDIFNKGIPVGDDLMEELYFLDPKTRELVEKMSHAYTRVVTPEDFSNIAKIMSKHLAEEVPILKDFTKYFGRLAEAYMQNAKPSNSAMSWGAVAKKVVLGGSKKGYVLPDFISEALGLKPGEAVSEKVLRRFNFYTPGSTLSDMVFGVKDPLNRATGKKIFKLEVKIPSVNFKKGTFGSEKKLMEFELFTANKLPKSWTNVPWVNFDGKVIEQNFTQSFEERLVYKNARGEWTTNLLQVQQKTEASWWEEISGAQGKINDIADVTKARTAFAVNG